MVPEAPTRLSTSTDWFHSAPTRWQPPEPSLAIALGGPLSTRRVCSLGTRGWACRFGDWVAVPKVGGTVGRLEGGDGLLERDGRAWSWVPSNPPGRPQPHFFQRAGLRVQALSPDGYCAVTADETGGGRVVCGHCGVCGPAEARTILTTLPAAAEINAVSRLVHDGGEHGVCLLTSEGRVQCVELGDAPWRRADALRPMLVDVTAALHGVLAVALADRGGAMGEHVGCALLGDGSVRCWGDNSDGQLGDGTFTSRRRPEPVVGLPKAVAIGVGRDHACARTQDGRVFCCGSARRGAAGLGLPPVRTSPVAVAAGR